jgi:two-component system response regulator FlrC
VSDETDMKTLEKRHILETLGAVGGVKKLAAEKLGISERTLRYKLQRYRDEDSAAAGQDVPEGNGTE